MSAGHSPTVRRQRLAAELRSLREAARLTNEQLAGRLGWSTAKLSRYENARQRPDVGDVMDLLDALQVTGLKRDQMIALAREANARGWWRAYGDDMSVRQRGYAELETGAVHIRDFSHNVVPGPLQTPDYGRCRLASLPTVGAAKFDLDIAVAARGDRQALITRDAAKRYEAVLDEAALRRQAAPVEVLRDQLRHLATLAGLPNITLRVLAFDADVESFFVAANTFTIYEFPDAADPVMVAVETETSDLHLGDEEDVARYMLVYEKLCRAALTPEESTAFIAALADHI